MTSLLALVPLLLSAFCVGLGVTFLVEPSRIDHHGSLPLITHAVIVGLFLLLACVAACAALLMIRRTISARLVVTCNGLVNREGRVIGVRATAISWSSITSFTVKRTGSGRRSGPCAVYATLDSGQQVMLWGTSRGRIAATKAIAGELTTRLREHRDIDRA